MLTEEEALVLAREVIAGKSRSYVGAAKLLAEYVGGNGGIGSDLHVKLDDENDPFWLPRANAAKVPE